MRRDSSMLRLGAHLRGVSLGDWRAMNDRLENGLLWISLNECECSRIAQLIRASMGFIFNWFIWISFILLDLWHEQLSRLAGSGHMLGGVNEISNLRVSQNRLISNDNCCCDIKHQSDFRVKFLYKVITVKPF